MMLSFWTDEFGQTVQTHVRLLLEDKFDQGLHCWPFYVHHLRALLLCQFVRIQGDHSIFYVKIVLILQCLEKNDYILDSFSRNFTVGVLIYWEFLCNGLLKNCCQ